MIFLEAFLFTILLFLLVSTSLSDLRTSRVPNKNIVLGLAFGILAIVPYYALFVQDCLISYVINNVLAFSISMILYSLGIWGAGDCKLLCSTVLLFPARLYCMNNRSMASCFLLITLIFITAFFYVIGETIVLGIRQKNLFQLTKVKISVLAYVKSFLFFFMFFNLWNTGFSLVAPVMIMEDVLLVTAIHFILLLVTMRLEPKASWFIIGLMSIAWSAFLFLRIAHFSVSNINWITYLVIALLILFRSSSEKYNYKTVEVSELKPGMILSLASTMRFANSKVQGLPSFSSEDLRSRLSVEEINSINRWAKTKSGCESLVIVRKIPFALFIAIGTIVFLFMEVLLI